HDTVERVRMAAGEEAYESREYLPGRLMTDLRADANGKRADGGASPPGGVRILVVDDDLGVCNSLRDVLQREHCEVFTARGGTEALKLVAERPVDVVLTDVVMPDM